MTSHNENSLFPSHSADVTPTWMGFLFHLAVGTIGAMLTVFAVSVGLSIVGVKSKIVDVLTLGPSFFLPVLSGLTLGYAFGRSFYSRAVGWVWLIPAAVLALVLTVSLLGTSTRAGTWTNMFGPESRCTSICLEQLFFSGPFLSSLAYTIGIKFRRLGVQN
jgi:hypothetical protein